MSNNLKAYLLTTFLLIAILVGFAFVPYVIVPLLFGIWCYLILKWIHQIVCWSIEDKLDE